MLKYYLLNFKIKDFVFLFLIIIVFHTSNVKAQCAGTSNTVTICDKELDPTLQNYDLYAQLISPTPGGTWVATNPINAGFLDSSTGVVNLWAINRYGIHIFTYNADPACDNSSATITINLGGYPGEDNVDGGANACSSESSVRMFSFLDNDDLILNADINGTWQEVTTPTVSGALSGNTFDANAAGKGTYTFTYTVGSVDTCPSEFSTVVLEVHQEPISGDAEDINLCESEDMSIYTNVDLRDQLSYEGNIAGEDDNGIWIDHNGTGQLTDPYDSTVNIQEIYNTFGVGSYSYTYTVYASHGICEPSSSTVTILIEEEYTLDGTIDIENTCLGQSITATVNYDTNQLPNDSNYEVSYNIYDSGNNLVNNYSVDEFLIENGSFTLTASINQALFNIGVYTFEITQIVNTSITEYCSIIVNVPQSSFIVFDPEISVDDICYGENATVLFNNVLDDTGSLLNGSYPISYSLEDPNTNTTNQITNPVTFTNGVGSFDIDTSLLQITFDDALQIDPYIIRIQEPSEIGLNCLTDFLYVNPIPEDIELSLVVDNQCNATNMDVIINAPVLSDGRYSIIYEVTEINSSEVLIDNSIVFIGGSANYSVDLTSLTEGNYEVVLRSIQDDTTPCRTQFQFELTEIFYVGAIPDPAVLDSNQNFCLSDYLPDGPTISDIVVDSGDNLTWYDDNASTIPLDPTTLLVDGEDYYVTTTDPDNSCQSSERTAVVVSIITTSTVTTINSNPIFCSSESPTIGSLIASTNGGTLVWYDSETGGNIVNESSPLIDGDSYYAVENIQGCESTTRLMITVTVIDPPTPVLNGDGGFCGLENPTLLDLEDRIVAQTGYDIIWYNAPQDGLTLNIFDELEDQASYYAASIEPISGCESIERLEIMVSLSECDPQEYDFFIPDGFSPNEDGRNDTFYIPNIEFFYPDFTLEIINRYGQSLFKGNINNPAWDGKNNKSGNESTSGVYFFILDYNKGNLKPKQGRLYLSK